MEDGPLTGSVFGNYRLGPVLGRGGMSIVYLAENVRLERSVALKFLAPELAGDPAFRERFIAESRLAAGLEARRAEVRRRVSGRRRPRALLLVWPDPPQAAGGGMDRIIGR